MLELENTYNEILRNFSRIPIEENERSYLDLCHYPGERFEEICSRILEFYFQPNNKHGFRNLWFRSLCQLIDCNCEDALEMKTRTEEFTFGAEDKNKRIDIILETPSLVVAIENKIGADLYNRLDIYKEHIEKTYPKHIHKLVVLTAHSFSGLEKAKACQNGFVVIQYDQLFKTVKSLIGQYLARGEQKHLVFMMDFIKTVENRVKMTTSNDLDKFFTTHKDEIEQMLNRYNDWKSRLFEQQKSIISELFYRIREQTDNSWWVFQGWDLGRSFNDKTCRIGIESHFEEVNNNPIGEFHILITTWNMKCWQPYEHAIFDRYPQRDGFILDKGESDPDRVYYRMPIIERAHYQDNELYYDTILNRLIEYYTFLKDLSSKYISQ